MWKNKYLVPGLILAAVLVLLIVAAVWFWPKKQVVEGFQDEAGTSLTDDYKIPDTNKIVENKDDYNVYKNELGISVVKIPGTNFYKQDYIIEIKGTSTKILVYSIITGTEPTPTIPTVNNLKYSQIIGLILSGKIKARHVSKLVGFMNYNRSTSGYGYYVLTDDGTESGFSMIGDIIIPAEQQEIKTSAPENVTYSPGAESIKRAMQPLQFDYYLVFHKDLIDNNNKPNLKLSKSDSGTGGTLNTEIYVYDNGCFINKISKNSGSSVKWVSGKGLTSVYTRYTMYQTIENYYSDFGYIGKPHNTGLADANSSFTFVPFVKADKLTKSPLGDMDVIVEVKSGNSSTNTKTGFRVFDRDNFNKFGRPFNLISSEAIDAIILAANSTQTTAPDVLQQINTEWSIDQRANVIYTGTGTVNLASSTGNKYTYDNLLQIPLSDMYYIKQIYVKNLFNSNYNEGIRVGIKNSRSNDIQYVNFAVTSIDTATNMDYAITIALGTHLIKHSVKTVYGNDIMGDEILIFSKAGFNTQTAADKARDIIITGFPENEKLDYEFLYSKAKEVNGNGTGTKYTDGEVSQLTSADVPSLITCIELDTIPTPLPTLTDDVGKDKKGSSITIYQPNLGDSLYLLFKNNYSNNTFTYPGPVNNNFLYHPDASRLFLTKYVIANKFKIYFNKPGDDKNTWPKSLLSYREYVATGNDINRFKLQFNVTDIRGSINPDSLCPSMDKFITNQLNSEVILDAMEYNDRINTEQAKLLSQKENMLTLLEQQEEINKLNRIINRMIDIENQRQNKTNAQNAIKFTQQIKEAMRLKDVLEARIAKRKKNTLNLAFQVNQVVDTELPTAETTTTTSVTREGFTTQSSSSFQHQAFEDIPIVTDASNKIGNQPAREDDFRITKQ